MSFRDVNFSHEERRGSNSIRDVNLYHEERRGSNSKSNTTSTTINTTNTSTATINTTTNNTIAPPPSTTHTTMPSPNLNMVRSLSVPITPPPSETAMDYQMLRSPTAAVAAAAAAKKTRPLVLHGKVLHLIDDDDGDVDDDGGLTAMKGHRNSSRSSSSRTVSVSVSARYHQQAEQEQTALLDRRRAFAKLTHDTLAFQKLVADLEQILEQSSTSPEASWRAKIIIRSAQEAETNLWDQLVQYEQSPLLPLPLPLPLTGSSKHHVGSGSYGSGSGYGNGTLADKYEDAERNQRELRTAQTACMKLHRDFNRSHKVLAMILSLHQQRQNIKAAEAISSGAGGGAAAVRWNDPDRDTGTAGTTNTNTNTQQQQQQQQQLPKKDANSSDRAMRRTMREREANLERQNKKSTPVPVPVPMPPPHRQSQRQVNANANANAMLYQDIGAASVDGGQQSDTDDNVLDDGAATVLSSDDDINCLFDRDRFCGAMNFTDIMMAGAAVAEDDIGYDVTERDDGQEKLGGGGGGTTTTSPAHLFSSPNIEKGEVFDWRMPFEHIGEDMKSVHRDIVRMGKDILQKGGEYAARESKSSSP